MKPHIVYDNIALNDSWPTIPSDKHDYMHLQNNGPDWPKIIFIILCIIAMILVIYCKFKELI